MNLRNKYFTFMDKYSNKIFFGKFCRFAARLYAIDNGVTMSEALDIVAKTVVGSRDKLINEMLNWPEGKIIQYADFINILGNPPALPGD